MNGKSEGVAFIRLKCPACAGTGRKLPIPPSTAGWPHGPQYLQARASLSRHATRPKVAVRAARFPRQSLATAFADVFSSLVRW